MAGVCLQKVKERKKEIKSLVYYFVSREKIIDINTTYLEHYYATDIITFDYCKANKISGEIYICEDVIKENATRLRVDFVDELNRVVFHGLLHLLGFKDKSEEEVSEMRNEEDKCLMLLKQSNE